MNKDLLLASNVLGLQENFCLLDVYRAFFEIATSHFDDAATCDPRKTPLAAYVAFTTLKKAFSKSLLDEVDRITSGLEVEFSVTCGELIERIRQMYPFLEKVSSGEPFSDSRDLECKFDVRGRNVYGLDRADFNLYGFNRNGYNRASCNVLGFNALGFDFDGYNRRGFHVSGVHKDGVKYDALGYDHDGYDRDGFDRFGFDREGFNYLGYNCEGLNRDGVNRFGLVPFYKRILHSKFDEYSYADFDGYHYGRPAGHLTVTLQYGDTADYLLMGWLRPVQPDAYDWKKERHSRFFDDGLPSPTRDALSFDGKPIVNRILNLSNFPRGQEDVLCDPEKYISGRDCNGFDWNGYDYLGFDSTGRNAQGFDEDGFDEDGFNDEGLSRFGYFAKDVYYNGLHASGYFLGCFGEGALIRAIAAKYVDAKTGELITFRQKHRYDIVMKVSKGEPGAYGYNSFGYDIEGYDIDGLSSRGTDRFEDLNRV